MPWQFKNGKFKNLIYHCFMNIFENHKKMKNLEKRQLFKMVNNIFSSFELLRHLLKLSDFFIMISFKMTEL